MKNLFLIALLTILTASCGSSAKEGQAKRKAKLKPAKTSSKIVKDYIDTLTTAPGKARSAAQLAEGHDKTTEDMIKELDQ